MGTLANSNQKKRRLEGKDFITIGIYTAQDIRVTDRASSFTNIVISIRTINMGEHGH